MVREAGFSGDDAIRFPNFVDYLNRTRAACKSKWPRMLDAVDPSHFRELKRQGYAAESPLQGVMHVKKAAVALVEILKQRVTSQSQSPMDAPLNRIFW